MLRQSIHLRCLFYLMQDNTVLSETRHRPSRCYDTAGYDFRIMVGLFYNVRVENDFQPDNIDKLLFHVVQTTAAWNVFCQGLQWFSCIRPH